MRGDERVIEFLNEQLTAELTAINQYFLHAKMQENYGWPKLARHTRAESIDEMRHAEPLTDRILFLDGLPNYQRLFPLRIGQTVREMFEADMAVEVEAVDRLRRGIEYMRGVGDITSANIFEEILADEEQHIDYLETQLGLLDSSASRSTSPSWSSSRATDTLSSRGDRRRVLVPAGDQGRHLRPGAEVDAQPARARPGCDRVTGVGTAVTSCTELAVTSSVRARRSACRRARFRPTPPCPPTRLAGRARRPATRAAEGTADGAAPGARCLS